MVEKTYFHYFLNRISSLIDSFKIFFHKHVHCFTAFFTLLYSFEQTILLLLLFYKETEEYSEIIIPIFIIIFLFTRSTEKLGDDARREKLQKENFNLKSGIRSVMHSIDALLKDDEEKTRPKNQQSFKDLKDSLEGTKK